MFKRKEAEWLKLQKEISEVEFEDIFPEDFCAEHIDGFPLDELEFAETKKAYFEQREQARIEFDNNPSFDPEHEKKNFMQSLKNNITDLKKNLPGK